MLERPAKRMKFRDRPFRLPHISCSYYPFDDEQRSEGQYGRGFYVATTESTAWGSPEIAASRALVEPDVTKANQELFRTHHPSLACALTVGIYTEGSGKRIWFTEHFRGAPAHTHAGGLEIHTIPAAFPINSLHFPRAGTTLIDKPINPRLLLPTSDVTKFASMFPRAVGFQVLLAARINILYKSRSEIEADWSQGVPGVVGGLEVRFSFLDIVPSTAEVAYGMSASTGSWVTGRSGARCLGLTLQLPSGKRALTAVTHGYVHLPADNEGPVSSAIGLYHFANDILRSYKASPGARNAFTGFVETQDRLSNTPVGKSVWAGMTNRRLGTVKETYDNPDSRKPYPAGYTHDLSLVEPVDGEACPVLGRQPGMPVVREWAELGEVLEGKPLFVTANLLHLANQQQTVIGSIIDSKARDDTLDEMGDAIAEGVQYSFNKSTLDVSVSLLWRCTDEQFTTVRGFSGSVLCLGLPTSPTTKAVLFQNFELPMRMPVIANGRIQLPDALPSFNLKGGFLLPDYILESTIVSGEDPPSAPPGATFPSRARPSGDQGKRSFSGL